jgi:hypothetical protein
MSIKLVSKLAVYMYKLSESCTMLEVELILHVELKLGRLGFEIDFHPCFFDISF